MKKLLSGLLVLAMCMALLVLPTQAAPKVLFQDDFSGSNLSDKWINPILDDDDQTNDNECKNVAEVNNGKLYLENIEKFGSFFYMAPKEIKLKDFTITFKVKANEFNTGWIGVSFRKDVNDRFNGCNNNMMTFDFGKKGQKKPVIYARGYRCYPGSSPVELVNKMDVDSRTPLFYQGDVKKQHEVRFEVKDTSFKAYMDGQLLGDWDYKKNNNPGFISLNCCIFDGEVDDFVITEYEALPKPEKPSEKPAEKPAEKPESDKPADKPDAEKPDAEKPEESSEAPSEEASEAPEELSIQDILKRKFEDVTVDYTFGAIRLDRALNVKEFHESFALAEGYTMKLVDAEGTEVTDQAAVVTGDMKLQVMQGDTQIKQFDLNVEAKQAEVSEPAEKAGFPVWGIVLIVVGAVLVIGAVVLIVLFRKGILGSKKQEDEDHPQ